MIDDSANRHLKNLDVRVGKIERILPTLATKEELRDEVAKLATKEELRAEVAKLATKEELRAEVAKLATKEELYTVVREEGERTRRHFDVVAESMRSEIQLALEGHIALTSRIQAGERRHENLEHRVTALEVAAARRKK